MSEAVRLAVLGAGSWTCVNHLPEIEARTDVRMVAVADTSDDRLENVRRRFPFDLVTSDVDEALATKPDAVIVGATPDAHRDLVGRALESGAHVLSEKPFCTRAVDAWQLVDMAADRGLHLLTAFGWNYQPYAAAARELLARHGIGTLEHAQIHMATALREMYQATMPVWGRPPEFTPVEGSYTKLSKGAGYAQAQLSHALGLALWLFPLRGASVVAFMAHPQAEVDLYDAIAIRSTDDATIALSGACHPLGAADNKHQLELRFFGSEGQLLLDLERERTWLYRSDAADEDIGSERGSGAYTGAGPASALIDLAGGVDGAENRSPGNLAASVTEIIQAAYASAISGAVEAITADNDVDPTLDTLP